MVVALHDQAHSRRFSVVSKVRVAALLRLALQILSSSQVPLLVVLRERLPRLLLTFRRLLLTFLERRRPSLLPQHNPVNGRVLRASWKKTNNRFPPAPPAVLRQTSS